MMISQNIQRHQVKFIIVTLVSIAILASPLTIYSKEPEQVSWFGQIANYALTSRVAVVTVASVVAIGTFIARNFLQDRRADLERLERFEQRSSQLASDCQAANVQMGNLTQVIDSLATRIVQSTQQAATQQAVIMAVSARAAQVETLTTGVTRAVDTHHAANLASFAGLESSLRANIATTRGKVMQAAQQLGQRVDALDVVAGQAQVNAMEAAQHIVRLQEFIARQQVIVLADPVEAETAVCRHKARARSVVSMMIGFDLHDRCSWGERECSLLPGVSNLVFNGGKHAGDAAHTGLDASVATSPGGERSVLGLDLR